LNKKYSGKDLVIIIFVIIAAIAIAGCDVSKLGEAKGGGCVSNGFECGDCIDNDNDGSVDYNINKAGKVMGDTDCESLTDDSESPVCTDTCNSKGYQCGSWSICSLSTNCGTCNNGYTCNSLGKCVLSCTDGCTSGTKRCYDSYSQTCADYDSNGCTEWNTGIYCSDGCNSFTKECNSVTCTDDCTQGQKTCVGNSYKICGEYDGDECLEWSELTDCGDETCADGDCIAVCTPESNSTFCTGLGKECGNITANDNCGNSRTVNCGTCRTGETCSNGDCVGGGDTDYTGRTCNIDGSATGSTCSGMNEDSTDATIDNCNDGPNGNFMRIEDMSVNATKVKTTDTVQVTCSIYCFSSSTKYAIAYNNGSGWGNIDYGSCSAINSIESKSKSINVDDVPGTHYFRCTERLSTLFTGKETCDSGSYSDNDDMSIEVISGSTSTYTLTTNVNPSGSGTVTKNPSKPTYNLGDSVQLTAAANSGYTFSSWSGSVTGTSNPITIIMNSNKAITANFASSKPTVIITATDASAGEPSDNGLFTVTRTGSTSSSLTVYYSTTGSTATAGIDYSTLSGYVIIPAGQSSATIAVNVIDDTIVESLENVNLTINSNTNYNIGSPNTATITIIDNDANSETGNIVVWGLDNYGQASKAPISNDIVAVAMGGTHNLALKADGSLVAWGSDYAGAVSQTPTGNDFKSVAAGVSYSVALKNDGSLVAWGYDGPNKNLISDTPTGNKFKAISAQKQHSVALKTDGSIVSWGDNFYGEVSNTPTGTGFKAIAAGYYHNTALKTDGSLVTWGANGYGQVSNTPTGNNFVAVAAGGYHSVALKSDGSLVSWGYDTQRQVSDTPSGNNFVAVAAGEGQSLALK
jgi:hypothetical protein